MLIASEHTIGVAMDKLKTRHFDIAPSEEMVAAGLAVLYDIGGDEVSKDYLVRRIWEAMAQLHAPLNTIA